MWEKCVQVPLLLVFTHFLATVRCQKQSYICSQLGLLSCNFLLLFSLQTVFQHSQREINQIKELIQYISFVLFLLHFPGVWSGTYWWCIIWWQWTRFKVNLVHVYCFSHCKIIFQNLWKRASNSHQSHATWISLSIIDIVHDGNCYLCMIS